MKYRKKPVVIEAIQFTPLNITEIEDFVGGDAGWSTSTGSLVIATLEGPMHASIGDFIIKGVRGEFYPCKPDIFAETYDPVPDPLDEKIDRLHGPGASAALDAAIADGSIFND